MVLVHGSEHAVEDDSQMGDRIITHLFKPLTPSLLFDTAIRLLAGKVEGSTPPRLRQRSISHLEAELPSIAGARLLLVEDNDINQEVASELLANAGFVVDIAGDGQAALQQLAQQAYDLVLMDMQMPVMDGLEATRRLRHRITSYNVCYTKLLRLNTDEGVLGADMSMNQLSALMAGMTLPPTGQLALFDQAGHLVAGSRPLPDAARRRLLNLAEYEGSIFPHLSLAVALTSDRQQRNNFV